jgi:hypothetical protein
MQVWGADLAVQNDGSRGPHLPSRDDEHLGARLAPALRADTTEVQLVADLVRGRDAGLTKGRTP